MNKQDVLYALLALDSYNRHDDFRNRKMSDRGEVEFGTQIGTATFRDSSDRIENRGEAGFYAVSYTVGDGVDGIDAGTTVISYRGTDNFC